MWSTPALGRKPLCEDGLFAHSLSGNCYTVLKLTVGIRQRGSSACFKAEFDLANVDSVPPDFHLIVDTPQYLKLPICSFPGKVAGSEHSCAERLLSHVTRIALI